MFHILLSSTLFLACGDDKDDTASTDSSTSTATETSTETTTSTSTATETTTDTETDTETTDTETSDPVTEAQDKVQALLDAASDAPIDNQEMLEELYVSFSAPGTAMFYYFPIYTVVLSAGLDPSVTCPVIEGDPMAALEGMGSATITSDCTDENGMEWSGTIEMTPEIWVYDNFKIPTEPDEDCPNLQGFATIDGVVEVASGAQDLKPAVVYTMMAPNEACENETATLAVMGEVSIQSQESEYSSIETWNGEGDVYANFAGMASRVHFLTEDEVIDSETCDSEAVSGTTTLSTTAHTSVITYDGATDCATCPDDDGDGYPDDCEPDVMVGWTLNGEDQGQISGSSCSSAVLPQSALLVLLGLAVVGYRRES